MYKAVAGCLTIVRVFKPKVNSDGELTKLRPNKTYFFIHTDDLRNSFDTYHKIKKQALDGFNSDNREEGNVIVNAMFEKPKRKK